MLDSQLVALVLAATALAVSGCGESSKATTLTRAELLTKADAICAHYDAQIHAHGSRTPQDIAHNIGLVASYRQKLTDELRKLTPPASMASDWKQILAGDQTLADYTVKVSPYVKENKLKAALPLIAASGRVQQQTLAITKRDGFKNCV